MNFKRSVMRILFTTAFLLLVAWIALKMMQYHGDWEAMTRDVLKSVKPVEAFFRHKVAPFVENAADFVKNTVVPWVKGLFGSMSSK